MSSGKSIIITGAGSGIGRVTARTFLKAGWRVGLIGRREEALRETAGDTKAALILPCDVVNPVEVDALAPNAADALYEKAVYTLEHSAEVRAEFARARDTMRWQTKAYHRQLETFLQS